MEDERDLTAGVMALTLLVLNAQTNHVGPTLMASLTAALKHQTAQVSTAEQATNAAAARARALVQDIGSAYPASVQAKAVTVLNQINYLLEPGGLRLTRPKRSRGRPATARRTRSISSYSGVLQILFALEGEITTNSGDVQLGDDVRALTALSSAEDQASQQRAILYGALLASALDDAVVHGQAGNNVTGPVGAYPVRRA